MERMLVVVCDNETSAYAGKSALHQLEQEGAIAIYAGAIVSKDADGRTSVKQYDDFGPVGGLIGTSVGSLIGLLGGPAGLAIGAASGFALGGIFDLDNVRVGDDFLDEVSKSLTPNKVAVVAEIDEEWTTPVDTRMESIGGTVYRRSLWEVRDLADEKETAALKAELAQLKAEQKNVNAARKAKLQQKVEQLQANIDAQQKKAKARRSAFEARQQSKREVLTNNVQAAGRALKQLATTAV
jgi:uncharacterized membrane protein